MKDLNVTLIKPCQAGSQSELAYGGFMFILKSFEIAARVYHVGCPKASDDKHFPTMVYCFNNFAGKVFKCTGCDQEIAVDIRIED